MYYNKFSNLLEKTEHIQGLDNVKEANLYKDIFPYSEVPKVAFNHLQLPMNTPKKHLAHRYYFQRRAAVNGSFYGRTNNETL